MQMIIADDEPVIMRGIQKLVDWKKLGIDIVGEYEDGASAFQGILQKRPQLALLDISMPNMSGVEILKELSHLNIQTKIIFISGFQDFEYAQTALKYGAVQYLLKPVIKDELMEAIAKVTSQLQIENWRTGQEKTQKEPAFEKLVDAEKATYLPVYIELLKDRMVTEQEEKLLRFSFISTLEEYVEGNHLGILIEKNGNNFVILKNVKGEDCTEQVEALLTLIKERIGYESVCIIGKEVANMGDIPDACIECTAQKKYLYFAKQLKHPYLFAGMEVFHEQPTEEEIQQAKDKLLDTVIAQYDEQFDKAFAYLKQKICVYVDGRKEDACFHYCSFINSLDKKAEELGLREKIADIAQLLEESRTAQNYEQMTELFRDCMQRYQEALKKSVYQNEKKMFLYAKEYIDTHFTENISLEILAKEVHMNQYYFSSYFKKHAGENFKDYVVKVRLKNAMNLLVSTDYPNTEVAFQSGFRDVRSFNEAFHKFYGETPVAYRKRITK